PRPLIPTMADTHRHWLNSSVKNSGCRPFSTARVESLLMDMPVSIMLAKPSTEGERLCRWPNLQAMPPHTYPPHVPKHTAKPPCTGRGIQTGDTIPLAGILPTTDPMKQGRPGNRTPTSV